MLELHADSETGVGTAHTTPVFFMGALYLKFGNRFPSAPPLEPSAARREHVQDDSKQLLVCIICIWLASRVVSTRRSEIVYEDIVSCIWRRMAMAVRAALIRVKSSSTAGMC